MRMQFHSDAREALLSFRLAERLINILCQTIVIQMLPKKKLKTIQGQFELTRPTFSQPAKISSKQVVPDKVSEITKCNRM